MPVFASTGSQTKVQFDSVELALDKKFEEIFAAIERRNATEIAGLLASLELAHAGRCGCSAPYFVDAQDHIYWRIRHNLEPQYNIQLWDRLNYGLLQLVRREFRRLMRDDSLKSDLHRDLELKFETFLAVVPTSSVWFATPEREDYVPHA